MLWEGDASEVPLGVSGACWCLSAAAAAAWAAKAMDAERAMVWPVGPAPGDVFVLLHSSDRLKGTR